MTAPLTDRERAVLEAVIETYVQTAEPDDRETAPAWPVARVDSQHDERPRGEGIFVPSPYLRRPHPDRPRLSRLRRLPDAAARRRARAGGAHPRRAAGTARRRGGDS